MSCSGGVISGTPSAAAAAARGTPSVAPGASDVNPMPIPDFRHFAKAAICLILLCERVLERSTLPYLKRGWRREAPPIAPFMAEPAKLGMQRFGQNLQRRDETRSRPVEQGMAIGDEQIAVAARLERI